MMDLCCIILLLYFATLDVIHTNCLVSHIKSFPPHTAPAGFACPSCSTSVSFLKAVYYIISVNQLFHSNILHFTIVSSDKYVFTKLMVTMFLNLTSSWKHRDAKFVQGLKALMDKSNKN